MLSCDASRSRKSRRSTEGGHLLVKRALRRAAAGRRVSSPARRRSWTSICARGAGPRARLSAAAGWRGRERAVIRERQRRSRALGRCRARRPPARPHRRCGRGPPAAALGAGRPRRAGRGRTPEFDFTSSTRSEVWCDDAARIYAQAVAAQWDPATAIPWDAAFDAARRCGRRGRADDDVSDRERDGGADCPEPLHRAAASAFSRSDAGARDPGRRRSPAHRSLHAARAAERDELGLSTAGGQASLKTLVDEPDFAIASFLLSVLGEGTFLSLLWFIERYAPDPVTAAVARLAAQDEARHVAFGLAHLGSTSTPTRASRAARRRHPPPA